MTATEASIGARKLRKEDPKLLTGEGKYVDDIHVPGELWMGMVRSTMAHARITGIDTSAAAAMDGVHAVYTGADLNGNSVTRQTTTLANGGYGFSGLPEGTYKVNQPNQPANSSNGTLSCGNQSELRVRAVGPQKLRNASGVCI